MKLNINKACDLSSISVFPPYSRRSNPVSSRADYSGSGKNMQTYHMRSQSQQPFSLGMSLSQLSQGSIDDVLTNEQKFSSQERDSTAKRLSCLAPTANSRDDSQMQQSRSSYYAMRKWNSTCAPDIRCHFSEELEHKIGLVEGSLSRFERTMDSIQSDLMQLTKAVKEVALEVAGMWQKIIVQDGHTQLMLKGEEDIKASISEILKSIHEQLKKEAETADQQRACKIADSISSLPIRIDACLRRHQNEICGAFTKEIEKRSCVAARFQSNHQAITKTATGQPIDHTWIPDLNMETETLRAPKTEKRRFFNTKHVMKPKHVEVLTELADDFKVITESDEEIDGGFSCLPKEKEADCKSHLSEEARRESIRILRRARRRKRKLDNTIVLD